MHFPRFLSIIVALSSVVVGMGRTLEDSVMIHFRQSKVNLDTAYMSNPQAFEHIRQMIEMYNGPDSALILRDVKVTGGASPEGSVRFNNWLSNHRAEQIIDYMERGMSLPDSVLTRTPLGRDWTGLRAMVIADSEVPYKDDVVALIDEIITNCNNGQPDGDANLQQLKRLHGGVPYLYLYYKEFPYLREASVVLTLTERMKQLPPADWTFPRENYGLITIEEAIPASPKAERNFYMDIRTNLIDDALCLPELGVEFYLGKNLSIVGNWMYGWWSKDSKHRYWRAYGGDLALRWWFGEAAHRKPLTGHHLGVYGGVVTYDFEFGGKGWMGGRPGHNLWDRCMHYCGIEYGYSLPIARRFNLDFTAGLGYMGGKYVEYKPNGICYEWLSTKQKHWWGPTKLEVSLVWLIGHGNYNVKKQKGAAK